MGGEAKYTHLVKGLDIRLYEKTLKRQQQELTENLSARSATTAVDDRPSVQSEKVATAHVSTAVMPTKPVFKSYAAEAIYKLIVERPKDEYRQNARASKRAQGSWDVRQKRYEYDLESFEVGVMPVISYQAGGVAQVDRKEIVGFSEDYPLKAEIVKRIEECMLKVRSSKGEQESTAHQDITLPERKPEPSSDEESDIFGGIGRDYTVPTDSEVSETEEKPKQKQHSEFITENGEDSVRNKIELKERKKREKKAKKKKKSKKSKKRKRESGSSKRSADK